MANILTLSATPDAALLKKLANTLGAAFAEDPFFQFANGDRNPPLPQWSTRLSAMYLGCLKFALARPRTEAPIHYAADGQSAAIWLRHTNWRVNPRHAWPLLYGSARCFRRKTARFFKLGLPLERGHPAEEHYYLWVVGTAPGGRGKGIGAEVLRVMLGRCDAEGVAAYLESTNERNVRFYERLGFKVMGRVEGLPRDCPPVVKMWREPCSGGGG